MNEPPVRVVVRAACGHVVTLLLRPSTVAALEKRDGETVSPGPCLACLRAETKR